MEGSAEEPGGEGPGIREGRLSSWQTSWRRQGLTQASKKGCGEDEKVPEPARPRDSPDGHSSEANTCLHAHIPCSGGREGAGVQCCLQLCRRQGWEGMSPHTLKTGALPDLTVTLLLPASPPGNSNLHGWLRTKSHELLHPSPGASVLEALGARLIPLSPSQRWNLASHSGSVGTLQNLGAAGQVPTKCRTAPLHHPSSQKSVNWRKQSLL